MGTAVLVIVLSALALCRADSPIQCDNATLHEVPSCRDPCPPERTCQNYLGPEPPCVPPSGTCTYKCVCADGYARNQYGGYCVTLDQCAKCPGNSQYFSCDGPYSENCTGSCHCATGYERDSNNVCVSTTPPPVTEKAVPPPPPIVIPSQPVTGGPTPVEECCGGLPEVPKPPLICNNETCHEILACIWGCPPERTCQNRNWPPLPCAPPPFPCTEKCICDDGYARNQEGGTCVTLEQCERCGENEYFECYGEYSEHCKGQCYCISQHTRDINDKCVYVDPAVPPKDFGPPEPIVEPPGKCGENEYFECYGEYIENCEGQCYCISQHTRDINDKCVYVDPAVPPKDFRPPEPEPVYCEEGHEQNFEFAIFYNL